ncbi:MAG: hypothetical protein COB02_18210 [Candidatus Cloacimonadota bacterium]|nr:MAG: hypothetical protein COB02_18210 [Candidatus Cloacimonadota bacterium]
MDNKQTYHTNLESSQYSEFSPGLVTNDEFIIRLHFHPSHYKNGSISSSAITLTDLLQKGLSVYRMMYLTFEKLNTVVDDIHERAKAKDKIVNLYGYTTLKASQIRELKDDGNQIYIVLDDADTKSNYAHASIYFSNYIESLGLSRHPRKQKSHKMRLRNQLLTLIEDNHVIGSPHIQK